MRAAVGLGTLPDNGGVPSVLVITLTAEQFASGTGTATTGHGQPISVTDALHLVDQTDVIPVALNPTGGIVAYGRMRRHATAHHRPPTTCPRRPRRRLQLPRLRRPTLLDRSRPHIIRWEHGGRTDLDNLTLVCGYHHREHQRQGWQCQMTDGVPHWLPPRWIDEHRTPLRNATHYLDRFVLPGAA